ncbi:hypothetical protein NUU61_003360 [Penicillium alfredii]|uniref:LDB19 N-terminal domain-containing protein n=1 Tax=Penicillium alfredii TaxID=1506179 RepID=A0A9W9FTB3_9EURO|nr:uncharacterized protein NUU61_003360 [Penicillium alfredii]KAJ5106013.1 hypothetical protein NUU61_003360 [Penicillium alfredii]
MDSQRLCLTAPVTHRIYTSIHGDTRSPLLEGGVSLPKSSDVDSPGLCQISVRLVQTVTSTADCLASTNKSQHALEHIRRRLPISRLGKTQLIQSSSTVEELKQDMTSSSQSRDQITFSLPVPTPLAGTTNTTLGSISYKIVATAVTADEISISTTRPIHIARQLVMESPKTIPHVCRFPKTSAVTELTLQHNLPSSGQKHSFEAVMFLQWITAPAVRPTEFKTLVVREINWRIEETTRLMRQSSGSYGNKPQKKSAACTKERTEKDVPVRIPFELTLPDREAAVDVDSSCSDDNSQPLTQDILSIAVERRIRLDIFTGEDTFDRRSRHLVDRKPRCSVSSASFLLPIDKPLVHTAAATLFNDVLPTYQDVSGAPPGYS